MLYLWVKAFHIVSIVCWFAGLFYLPRLFVYHAQSEDTVSKERFSIMERKLYRGIMGPAMIATRLCTRLTIMRRTAAASWTKCGLSSRRTGCRKTMLRAASALR